MYKVFTKMILLVVFCLPLAFCMYTQPLQPRPDYKEPAPVQYPSHVAGPSHQAPCSKSKAWMCSKPLQGVTHHCLSRGLREEMLVKCVENTIPEVLLRSCVSSAMSSAFGDCVVDRLVKKLPGVVSDCRADTKYSRKSGTLSGCVLERVKGTIYAQDVLSVCANPALLMAAYDSGCLGEAATQPDQEVSACGVCVCQTLQLESLVSTCPGQADGYYGAQEPAYHRSSPPPSYIQTARPSYSVKLSSTPSYQPPPPPTYMNSPSPPPRYPTTTPTLPPRYPTTTSTLPPRYPTTIPTLPPRYPTTTITPPTYPTTTTTPPPTYPTTTTTPPPTYPTTTTTPPPTYPTTTTTPPPTYPTTTTTPPPTYPTNTTTPPPTYPTATTTPPPTYPTTTTTPPPTYLGADGYFDFPACCEQYRGCGKMHKLVCG